MDRNEAITQLEEYDPCDILVADRVHELADPFDVEIDMDEMRPLDEAVPIYMGDDHLGMSVSRITVLVARGVGVAVERHRSSSDHGFIAREMYEYNLAQLRDEVNDNGSH